VALHGSQLEQLGWLDLLWYLLAGHASHELCPWEPWNLPGKQGLQKACPVLGWRLPTGHALHPCWLVSVWN